MALGIYKLQQGKIIFDNCNLAEVSPEKKLDNRKNTGIIFQNPYIIDHLTVYENAYLPLHILGFSSDSVRGEIIAILEFIGLKQRIFERAGTISGGEKQCLALAQVLVRRPSFVVCDEPTANLDSYSARRVMRLLQEYVKIAGSILMATHDLSLMDSAEECTRVVLGDRKVHIYK